MGVVLYRWNEFNMYGFKGQNAFCTWFLFDFSLLLILILICYQQGGISTEQIKPRYNTHKYAISEENNHCVSTLRHRHAKGWVAHQDVPLSKQKMQDKVTK